MREVLTLLQKAGITLKLKKCKFFDDQVEYLGHITHPSRLEVNPRNTGNLLNTQSPTNPTELRYFLGIYNVYKRFLPNFARVAASLNKLTGKNLVLNFIRNQDQLDACNKLRRFLVSPPLLALPRNSYKCILDTDSYQYQVGCCLLHEQPNGDRLPVCYFSRSLTAAERNYTTSKRECLAVVWGVLDLHPYLYGSPFPVRTYHDVLKWLMNLTDGSGQSSRNSIESSRV